jgi:hypothetical protein
MTSNKKSIVGAAKQQIVDRLEQRQKELQEEIENSGYSSSEMIGWDVKEEFDEVSSQIEELKRKKSLKKKIKNSIQWKADRNEHAAIARTKSRIVIRDQDALSRVRKNETAKFTPIAGQWLHEGALVTRRSDGAALLVVSLGHRHCTVLDGTVQRTVRNVALRPLGDDDD